MQMIATAVSGLTKLQEIIPAVQALGRRHTDDQVTAPMYDTVGAALLDTLEKGLGDDWTPELKDAWTKTYTTLAAVMIEAQSQIQTPLGPSAEPTPQTPEQGGDTLKPQQDKFTPQQDKMTPQQNTLTPQQIDMVQTSWNKVKPIQATAADLFYGKLFELDPDLRPLFPQDMTEQKKKLMLMISTAVSGLTKLQEIVPAVQALGRRHADYQVTAPMYDTVGAALLDTLEKGLGDDWTPELKDAWVLTYTTLADVMIAAQEDAAA